MTLYEIILVGPDRNDPEAPLLKWRLPLWTRDKGRGSIMRAVRADWDRVVAACGEDSFEWYSKRQEFQGRTFVIRASGRTEASANTEGHLPILPDRS